jgi:hypothetical protein
VNKFGKGRCVYLAPSTFSLKQSAQQDFGAWLLKEFSPNQMVLETDAPPCVEIAFLKSSKADAWLLGFVNYQVEQPNVPVAKLRAKIALNGKTPKNCIMASNGEKMDFKIENGALLVEIENLSVIEMIEIEF